MDVQDPDPLNIRSFVTRDEYVDRAFRAYFRIDGINADRPSERGSTVETAESGRHYVVLRNVRGALAVYRIGNDARLRRLRRWPKEIE